MNSFDLADHLMATITDAYEMGYDAVYLTPNYLGCRGIAEKVAIEAANKLVTAGAVSGIDVEPDKTIVIRIKETLRNIATRRQ